jgi:hypothetical protein
MAKPNSSKLRGETLAAHAAKLGIALEEFRGPDGAIDELGLRQRISMVERYSSEFHFAKLFVVCVAAFGVCGLATWLAVHFLWHAY